MLEQLQASPVLPHKEVQRLQQQLEASWRARTLEQKALRDCSDERDIREEENARLRKELLEAEAALACYRTSFQEEYKERRRLHNVVMVRLASVCVWPMRHTAGCACVLTTILTAGASRQHPRLLPHPPAIGHADFRPQPRAWRV
jgi:hypothetical protein